MGQVHNKMAWLATTSVYKNIIFGSVPCTSAVIPKVWGTVDTLHLGPIHLYVLAIIERIDR